MSMQRRAEAVVEPTAEPTAERAGATVHNVYAPGSAPLSDLLALADALDAALTRRDAEERAALAEARDAVGDHLVALSAVGISPAERLAVSRSLTSVLCEATEQLRAVRSRRPNRGRQTADVRRSCS